MSNNKIKRYFTHLHRNPFITHILLFVMIIMYLVMSLNGGSQNPVTLIVFGAKVNEMIVMWDWWRLITPAFLHIGLPHLIFNGLVIYYLGSQLELLIGHFRYFLLFIFSALMGNTASFAFNQSISAGASTAIFGFFASTIVLAKLYPNQLGIKELSRNYSLLILINIVWGLMSRTVDNAGHIGGLLGGYLIMYAVSSPNAWNNSKKQRILYAFLYIVVLGVLLFIGFRRTTALFY